MQTTALVGELKFGHKNLRDSLNFYQSGTRVNENWNFQLDGVPIRTFFSRGNCPIGVYRSLREVSALMVVGE